MTMRYCIIALAFPCLLNLSSSIILVVPGPTNTKFNALITNASARGVSTFGLFEGSKTPAMSDGVVPIECRSAGRARTGRVFCIEK